MTLIVLTILSLFVFMYETWEFFYNPIKKLTKEIENKSKELDKALNEDEDFDSDLAVSGYTATILGCGGATILFGLSVLNWMIAIFVTIYAVVTKTGNVIPGMISLILLVGISTYNIVGFLRGICKGIETKTDEVKADTKQLQGFLYRFLRYLPMAYIGYFFLLAIGIVR